MALLLGNDLMQAYKPEYKHEVGKWIFGVDGCPALTDQGCRFTHAERPFACRLFPFIPVPVYDDEVAAVHTELFLAVKRCPNWLMFGKHYKEAMEELHGKEG